MKNRISVITGTYPPEKCGVGDFTFKLLQTSEAKNWDLLYFKNWKLSTLFDKIRKIKKSGSEIINIQYPSMGYGYSILPHFLCFYFSVFSNKKFTITFHEFSRLGVKSRIAAYVFLLFSWKIIFTNEYERLSAIKHFPLMKNKSYIIKIFSNITAASILPEIQERKFDVGYFGFISPLKGLEDFILVSKELLLKNPDFKIYIMGQTQPEYESYYKNIINEAKLSNITLFLNQSENFVSNTLSNTKLCYLPYPDGISERRGSFLAAVINLCMVHTTKGQFTTKAHENFCTFSVKESAAIEIEKLLFKNPDFFRECQRKIISFIKNEIPSSWEDVAIQYNKILDSQKN
jgi:glycosyltransferase involved in cell wall biosynthesis